MGNKDNECCGVCKDSGNRNGGDDWVKCETCRVWYHTRCQNEHITKEIYDLLKKFDAIMKKPKTTPKVKASITVQWKCGVCVERESQMEEKAAVINDKLDEIMAKVKNISQNTNVPKISYANAVKNASPSAMGEKRFFPRVTIKSKIKKDKTEFKKEIENVVKDNLGKKIKINKIINDDEGFKVECADETALKNLQSSLDSNKYECIMPKLLLPRLKVINVFFDVEMSDEEIVTSIVTLNEELDNIQPQIKVIKRYVNNPEKGYTVVIECDPITDVILRKKGRILCCFSRCQVYECIGIRQCGKCYLYTHSTTECKSEKKCMKCCEDHLMSECNNEVSCINCILRNKKFDQDPNYTKLQVNHQSNSRECFCRKIIEESIRRRILKPSW